MWPAIIGAAAGNAFDPVKAGGEYFFNRQAAMEQNEMNRRNMNDANAWVAHMSNSAHQREVADLKAAGLNSILSAGGKGASTPGAAPAPDMQVPALTFPGIHGVGELLQNQQRIEIDRAKAVADIEKKIAETDYIPSKKKLIKAQTIATGRGAALATVEKEAAGLIQNTVDWLKKIQLQKPKLQSPNRQQFVPVIP